MLKRDNIRNGETILTTYGSGRDETQAVGIIRNIRRSNPDNWDFDIFFPLNRGWKRGVREHSGVALEAIVADSVEGKKEMQSMLEKLEAEILWLRKQSAVIKRAKKRIAVKEISV